MNFLVLFVSTRAITGENINRNSGSFKVISRSGKLESSKIQRKMTRSQPIILDISSFFFCVSLPDKGYLLYETRLVNIRRSKVVLRSNRSISEEIAKAQRDIVKF